MEQQVNQLVEEARQALESAGSIKELVLWFLRCDENDQDDQNSDYIGHNKCSDNIFCFHGILLNSLVSLATHTLVYLPIFVKQTFYTQSAPCFVRIR